MEKTYHPASIEKSTYEKWENHHYFAPNYDNSPAYCIMQPPPNVTGSLHMGHGFQLTLMDILIRYHRMAGFNTLWQGGTDHAGISTQMVVERQLAGQGKTRKELGREAFLGKVWEWKEQSGDTIMQQIRRLGCSLDWSRARFTMDNGLSEAVKKVFITLYDEGLIYRGKRLVNWDPKLCTAISDLEVLSEEEAGHLWHIRYPLSSGKGHIIVATTRPETMLGDTAVAVNPQDKRYQHLIGQTIKLPLTDREIPIIADDYVDAEFGSGCVKITPAHDFNDYAVGQRHQLSLINIFTVHAHLNENVPITYQGLERFAAREKIIADLQTLNLIEKIETHTLKVPRGERTGVVIEPLLTDQWYVKIEPLAAPAIAAVRNGETQFVPENWSKTYFQWMENIQDWCISRQLWWGHRIPAWYDAQKNIYVAEDEAAVRQKYNLPTDLPLQQDEDVLDTWFSSALWPFSTLDWPQQTEELNLFYPSDVLVTGFDIIFFWVARMMMFGLKFMGKVPFKKVYITGLVRDAEGQKMSKTKGNVLDPIDLIDGIDLASLIAKRTYGLMQPSMEQRIAQATKQQFPNGIAAYGTDALRFTFCAIASNNRNIRFDVARLEGYRNFCNKLWNAARYVLMNVDNKPCHLIENTELSLADQWILSLLQKTVSKAQQDIENYRFDFLAQTLYEFTWHEYCDWYLELSKAILNDEKIAEPIKQNTRHTLIQVLETILRLLHPIIPFITESIWQEIAPLANITADTIMLQPYPVADNEKIAETAEQDIAWVKNVILGVRNIRGEMNISPAKKLLLLFHQGNDQDKKRLAAAKSYLLLLAKLESIDWLHSAEKPPAATAIVGELELLVPLAGLIDKEAELLRLTKEIEKINKEIDKCQQKLGNESFVAKAPSQVVEQEKQRLAEMQTALQKLSQQKEEMAELQG